MNFTRANQKFSFPDLKKFISGAVMVAVFLSVIPTSFASALGVPRRSDLILWGPNGGNGDDQTIQMSFGQTIIFTASSPATDHPQLIAPQDDSFYCDNIGPEPNNTNDRWQCKATIGSQQNPQIFIGFIVDGYRSNVITVQIVDSSPPSVNVTANNSAGPTVTIPSGADVSIAWTSTNTTSCAVSSNVYSRGGLSSNSSIVVHNLAANTTFTITCLTSLSSGPMTASNSVTVNVVSNTQQSVGAGSQTRGNIPPAGYENEVLTNFNAYRNPFPDTNLNAVSGKAAAELYRRSVIGGFPDGQFKGDRSVNRAEAAKFLLLARFGSVADVTNSGRFPDVLDGEWYTKFVVTAAQKGIINGYPDGLFRPADQVNTAEFLKMLSLTFDLQLNMSYRYSDVPSDSWFAQYAGIAQKYNLFPNRSSYLSPETPLTRADVAIAIYQYLSQR